jgi:hypothetical protein
MQKRPATKKLPRDSNARAFAAPPVAAQKLLQALEQIAIRDLKIGDKMKVREMCDSGLLMNGFFK